MANEIIVTVVGNLVADAELRYSQNGIAVANGTIASTPRTYNRQKNEWEDGEAVFLRFSVWREYAENVAASLTKGTRVIAQGRLKQRSYEDREGNKRTVVELEVDEYRYDDDLHCWVLVEEPTLTDDPRTRMDVHTQRVRSQWDLVTTDESTPGLVRDIWAR